MPSSPAEQTDDAVSCASIRTLLFVKLLNLWARSSCLWGFIAIFGHLEESDGGSVAMGCSRTPKWSQPCVRLVRDEMGCCWGGPTHLWPGRANFFDVSLSACRSRILRCNHVRSSGHLNVLRMTFVRRIQAANMSVNGCRSRRTINCCFPSLLACVTASQTDPEHTFRVCLASSSRGKLVVTCSCAVASGGLAVRGAFSPECLLLPHHGALGKSTL